MAREKLIFFRNGVRVELDRVGPNETLLDYLRLRENKTGTKEGCNEGDCGACTVALGRLQNGRLFYEPVNSCIQLLGQVDGADVIIVDDLAEQNHLHPVQKAMVDEHGSQCGFCTPGIVMSLFTLSHSGEKIDRSKINDWLAGNLCRCTGYRPIVDAMVKICQTKSTDQLSKNRARIEKEIVNLQDSKDLFIGSEDRFFAAPASIGSLAKLAVENPDATILAGATDVGLWITKQLRVLPKIIHVGRAKGFADIMTSKSKLTIGAGATYQAAFSQLSEIDPDIGEVMRRLGSRHVRAGGTIGGNIANGSPIGDMPPLLIVLGASIELLHGTDKRSMALEDFFVDYGKQDRKPGELVSKIIVPKLKKHEHFRSYKISKRFDQDISAVLFATKLTIRSGRIASARIAFGGMAATPKRARKTEAAFGGLDLGDQSKWEKAINRLEADFVPLSDMRASKEYRMQTAKNLLFKALTEIATGNSANTRIVGVREAGE